MWPITKSQTLLNELIWLIDDDCKSNHQDRGSVTSHLLDFELSNPTYSTRVVTQTKVTQSDALEWFFKLLPNSLIHTNFIIFSATAPFVIGFIMQIFGS